ncbi:MAG TPA: FUSC family protein [Jatrophihabitans sp.]|jgi:uncharacterized membrane protein YccC
MVLRPLANLLRDAVRLDRSQSDPLVAARNAIGIALPLVVAALTGSVSAGLASTIGALQTGLADRPGPYRLRVLRMLGTAFAASVTGALAVLASPSTAASVLLLLVLAFIAGLLVSGGPSATQVGIAATAAAIVLGHIPQPGAVAVHVGLLVFAGGLVQVALAVAAWPLGRHAPERHALAALYRELADAARRPPGTAAAPAAATAVETVRDMLYGLGHDHGPSVEAYQVLLDEAERIRREFGVLTALIERLIRGGAVVEAGLARGALSAAGGVLGAVADALTAGRPVPQEALDPARTAVRTAIERLEVDAGPTRRATATRLRALAGQLRAVLETTATGAGEGRRLEAADLPGGPRLRDPLAVLRANLTPGSQILRHAVRTALLVAGSDLVVRLTGSVHGYWVSLTVLVVLRPDFASTFQRVVLRVAGTVVGLVVATELLHWVPVGTWYLIALVALFYFGMRLAGPANVGPTAVSLSAMVVVLLALNGVPPHDTLVARSVATLIGGVLAVPAALLLVVWEHEQVPGRLAGLLAAYRAYLAVLADPTASRGRRERARTDARLARTNAVASVDRARAEPVGARSVVTLGEGVLAHSHRVVHALMTLDALRAGPATAAVRAELDAVLRAAEQALASCEQALRTATAPRQSAELRPLQDALHAALRERRDEVGNELDSAGALADATDRLVDATNSLVAQLRRDPRSEDDERTVRGRVR